ncbi:MAG TPA: CapA family protein [Ardenticatenaceae bacterium]|nr:CapA family protein [Ardenticatenaceae bacterium]
MITTARCFILALLLAATVLPVAAQPPLPTIIVAWGGDTMFGRGIAEGMAIPGHADPLALLRDRLAISDLQIANLEGPLTTQPRVTANPYNLTAPPERVSLLVAAGFDAVSVANNHATDNDRSGAAETVATLREAGILPIGGGNNAEEAYAPVFIDHGGLRLALLAYDVTGACFPATADAAGCARFDPATARAAIAAAREQANVVIVQLHWGVEYAPTENQEQRAIAHQLAAAGADAVIGHHPHVVQPVEWIARVGRRPTFVAYSLGNFVFDSYAEDARRGTLIETLLTTDGVIAFRALPFYTDWQGLVPLDTPEAHAALTERLLPNLANRVSVQLKHGAWWMPPKSVRRQ